MTKLLRPLFVLTLGVLTLGSIGCRETAPKAQAPEVSKGAVSKATDSHAEDSQPKGSSTSGPQEVPPSDSNPLLESVQSSETAIASDDPLKVEADPTNPSTNANAEEGSPAPRESRVSDDGTSTDGREGARSGKPTFSFDASEASEAKGNASWYRYVLELERGPFLLDLQITVDGQSLTAGGQKIRNHFWSSLFNESVDVPWKEVFANKRIRDGYYPNLKFETEDQEKQILQLYDRNRDGNCEPRELIAFFTRGLSEKGPFVLDEASRYRGENRDQSPIFLRLDSNRDGLLSVEEISMASVRLRAMDVNADFILSVNEARLLGVNPEAYRRQKQIASLPIAFPIRRNAMRETLKGMQNTYGFDGFITEEAWPSGKTLFRFLDRDEDQRLNLKELEGIESSPSDCIVSAALEGAIAELGPTKDEGESAPGKGSVSFVDQPEVEMGNLLNRQGIRLKLQTQDFVSRDSTSQRVATISQALGISREIPKALGTFEANLMPNLPTPASLDLDLDEKVSWKELEVWVSTRSVLTSCFVRVRLIDVPDAWFAWLDKDWDNVLSEAEIEGCEERLLELRTDRDSEIAPESLPVHLEVFVSRQFGEEDPFRSNPQDVMYVTPAARSVPDWFSSLDSNGDGVVTPREFLGDGESFRKLDKDSNSLLDMKDLY